MRLLAALDDTPTPAVKDAFAQRLSRWFDWTDAIALSAALDCPAAPSPEAPVAPLFAAADEREARRVRMALAKLIAGPPAAATVAGRPHRTPTVPTAPAESRHDFATHRERCIACQQAMDAAVAPLRRRLRATLEGASPALARLAALDAVMEQVVGAQERALLATVPLKLEQHFARLRQAHREAGAEPGAAHAEPPPPSSTDWLDTFSQDMRDLLLAELDLRLQPVEGLLEALRGSSTDHHE